MGVSRDVGREGASTIALRALAKHSSIDAVHTIEAAPTLDTSPWPRKLQREIIDLCRRESRVRGYALGFKGSGGLLATARRAPNNLPAVFWQAIGDWSPLFPQRKVTAEVAADLSGYEVSEPLSNLAARVGQPRVSRNRRLEYMRPASKELLRALLVVHRSAKNPTELAGALATPVAKAEALLDTLHRFGLVDEQFRITSKGRGELIAQKRALRRTTAQLEGSDATYYPQSLK